MGSIHERLTQLQGNVKAEQQKKAELEVAKKKMLKESLLEGERSQYPKLVILKEQGILAMLADATNGREMEPEWPLSYEERLEKGRQRTAEWLEKVKNTKPGEKPRSDSLSVTSNRFGDYEDQYWQVEVMPPGVTDNLEWDEKVEIIAVKKEKRTRNWQTVHEEVAKVTIGFDGVNLTIAGQDISFVGPIPENEGDTSNLEEAFIRAFFYPEDIRVKPLVPPHRHSPELYAG